MRASPDLDAHDELSTSGRALELVRAHRVELAIVGGMTVPPELELEPLLEDDVVLVGTSLASGRLRARPRGADVDLARGRIGDARRRRGRPLAGRAASRAHARAPIVGGGQASCRGRSGDGRDRLLCDRGRARERDARGSRPSPLATGEDDRGRHGPRCPADYARAAFLELLRAELPSRAPSGGRGTVKRASMSDTLVDQRRRRFRRNEGLPPTTARDRGPHCVET